MKLKPYDIAATLVACTALATATALSYQDKVQEAQSWSTQEAECMALEWITDTCVELLEDQDHKLYRDSFDNLYILRVAP